MPPARARVAAWRALLDAHLPLGRLAGRWWWPPLKLDDPALGALTSFPVPTRFHLGPMGSGFPRGIGRRAHAAHFADAPPLVVKVQFACAGAGLARRGPYPDPSSPWHNVFFGAYEVRVDAEAWGRPFAFEAAAPEAAPRGEDVVRLGKADWNDLSNGLYGVPRAAAAPHDALGPASWREEPAIQVRDAAWRTVSFTDASAVSAWRNPDDGATWDPASGAVGVLWRLVFGHPPRGARSTRPSFAATRHGGRFWLRWVRCRSRITGRPCFRTFVAGAVVREDHPDDALRERILGAQTRALRPFIEAASAVRGRP